MLRVWIRFVGGLVLACLAAWIVKSTVVSISRISSVSMLPTLAPGEYVLIHRSSYRLRTPDTVPLSSFALPSASTDGWSIVKRGDLVAFLSPQHLERGVHPSRAPTYIKRCVAVPGDTVRIVGHVLQVRTGSPNAVTSRSYALSTVDASHEERAWVVPAKGDTLSFETMSRDQMRRIIRRDEHHASFFEHGIRLDGAVRSYYVARQNYYFVLGDNPAMSRDSRHWGLVPESSLLGEVLGVVWPLER